MVKKRHKLKKSLGGICFILDCANAIMGICSNIIKLYIFNIWSFVADQLSSRKLFKKKKHRSLQLSMNCLLLTMGNKTVVMKEFSLYSILQ